MAARLRDVARQTGCRLAAAILILIFASSAANAAFFNLLRQQMTLADLRVESFVLDKSEASSGETLTATVKISNEGKVSATSTVLTFSASGQNSSVSDASQITTVNLGTLQPQTRLTQVATFSGPAQAGTYQVLAALQTSSAESNTQNNTGSAPLLVKSSSPAPPTPPTEPDPPASPPTPPAAETFAVGDRVMVTVSASVRSGPGSSSGIVGTAAVNSAGAIVGGPATADSETWWQVNFDTARDGWFTESRLVKPMISRFFASNSTWYMKIPANPAVTSGSANYVSRLAAEAPLAISLGEWSVPVFYARPDTPYVAVRVLGYRNSAVQNDTTVIMVPIPPEARPAGFKPVGDCYSGNSTFCYRDGHMTVISADRKTAWDFSQLGVDPFTWDPNYAWAAPIVGARDLTGHGVNQPYGSIPDAKNNRVCPTPLLHGIVTYEEIKRGVIDHAVAFSTGITKANANVYPCESPNTGNYTEQWASPLGARYQLDPNLDINTLNLTPAGKIVAKALQEYGMILVESAGPGNNAIYAESLDDKPDKWGSIFGSQSLTGIPLNRLRLVEPIIPSQ